MLLPMNGIRRENDLRWVSWLSDRGAAESAIAFDG